MKKTLLTLSALALMATATPALAALDETEISVIDLKPSEFARDFNRLNKANGQAFKPIKLSNTYGEQRVNLAPNIYMLVGAHTDAIEYIDYICNKPALTSKKCMVAMPWIGSAVDPNFNQVSFMLMVGRNLDINTTVSYQQNDVEYHFIPDKKKNQIRLEIKIID